MHVHSCAESVDGTNACEVTDGILSTDDDEMMCCPTGCGTCGGDSCNNLPMSWVQPGDTLLSVDASVPEGASSGGEQELYANPPPSPEECYY